MHLSEENEEKTNNLKIQMLRMISSSEIRFLWTHWMFYSIAVKYVELTE